MKKILFVYVVFIISACSTKPVSNFSWSPQSPKAGQEVQFTNLSTDAKKYDWNLGNMKISSEKNPKNTYTSAGNYIVDLTVHNGLKSDVKTVTLEVIP